MSVLTKLLRESYDLQEERGEETAYWHLQQLRQAIKDEQIKGETLPIDSVVFSEAELKAKLEEQKEEIRQWLIDEDFEGLAERL